MGDVYLNNPLKLPVQVSPEADEAIRRDWAEANLSGGAGGDKHYRHIQTPAASTWSVTHNLGKYPSVAVVDASLNIIFGDVHYVNTNSLTIVFSSAITGEAYCN